MRRISVFFTVLLLAVGGVYTPNFAHGEDNPLYTFSVRGQGGELRILKGTYKELTAVSFKPALVQSFSKVNRVHILEGILSPDPDTVKQWSLTLLEQDTLYNKNARGAGMTIAVIDTGVDKNHKEFGDRVLPGYSVYSQSSDGGVDDNGHGTHVAGIIAAGRNGYGIEGLAPEVKILPVKVLDETGYGDDADVAKGLVWAVDHGANIASMSLGGNEPNSVLADAIVYARSKNVAVVVAAGNNGAYSPVIYPASNPGALAVGASGGDNKVAFFSSQGEWVDVVAPGVSILSTWPGNSYRVESGTSMATPYVSATLALIASYLNISPLEAEKITLETCTDIYVASSPDGRDNSTGCGIIDPYWAITHSAPRLLKDRNSIPLSQIPAIITAPTIELPKLVAPTLPPLPKPELPKMVLPTPASTFSPKYTPLEPVTPPIGNVYTDRKNKNIPQKKSKKNAPALSFSSYYSLNNTIINVSYKGVPLTNKNVVLITKDSSRVLKTNYLGRVVIDSRVVVVKVILNSN